MNNTLKSAVKPWGLKFSQPVNFKFNYALRTRFILCNINRTEKKILST